MNGPVRVLLLFVKENDVFEEQPLYMAIIHRLRQLEIAGATAHAGLMGFGRHHHVHHKGLFGISDDRPITIVAVDDDAKLRNALPELRAMVGEGLILLVDAEVVNSGT